MSQWNHWSNYFVKTAGSPSRAKAKHTYEYAYGYAYASGSYLVLV
jgi:hypothetical protein